MPRKREIWQPPPYTAKQHRAVQALFLCAEGVRPEPLTQDEVKTALDWLLNEASAVYDNGFVADDPNGHIGAFMDGRQFAGQQFIKLGKLKLELKKNE